MGGHQNPLNGWLNDAVKDMDNICYAGIVTFNPDIERLEENVSAISKQVPVVVIFDNGSQNIVDIESMILIYKNVELLKSNLNVGIAAALNKLMQWGLEQNYIWMLSLDQDSVCDEHYVTDIKAYFNVETSLGIVAPVIVDRSVGIVGHNPKKAYSYVNTCITSGACSKIEAWKKIGGYDEKMFIDSVDFEYCYRMRKYGYGVIQVKNVQLLHQLGESQKRRFLFLKVDVTGHSPFRKYFIARNNVYYPLKHHLWLHFFRGNLRNIRLIVLVVLYESNKKDKIRSICKGWKDAYLMERMKNDN